MIRARGFGVFLLSSGPQQAEILDTDAEIRAEILLEIRDPKSQAIFSDYFRKNTEIHIT